jgi:hypothetical protein
VAATLGPQLVASAGFVDAQLIGDDAWDSLRTQYLTWAADAQRRALGIAEGLVPLSAAHRAEITQRQTDDLTRSWEWLSDELTKLAHTKLYQPDPAEPVIGESDPTVSIPAGLIRQAIARAGGATGIRTGQRQRLAAATIPSGGNLDVPPDASVFVATDNGAPLGGIGTGDTTMSVLDNGEIGVEAYQWEYGPAFRAHPFDEHEALDQEIFTEFDSDVLAAGDWIGDFYFPGDHDGCNCDIVPIIVEQGAIDDTADVFGSEIPDVLPSDAAAGLDDPTSEAATVLDATALNPTSVTTRADLEAVAQRGVLPADTATHEFFYHSLSDMRTMDAIVEEGLKGRTSTTSVFLSKDEIRDLNSGFVIARVPTGVARIGEDVIYRGLSYREWTVDRVPANDIVRAVRAVPDSRALRSGKTHLRDSRSTIRRVRTDSGCQRNTSGGST